MLSTIQGATYVERVAVNNPANVRKTKKAIKNAFENQIAGNGFSIVEVLSTCNVNWGMTPVDALRWMEDKMMPEFPLGLFRSPEKDGK